VSFCCQKCNQPQPPHTQPRKVVTKVRSQTYRNNQVETLGWEIVEEMLLCEPCEVRTPSAIPAWAGALTIGEALRAKAIEETIRGKTKSA